MFGGWEWDEVGGLMYGTSLLKKKSVYTSSVTSLQSSYRGVYNYR